MGIGHEFVAGGGSSRELFCLRVLPGAERLAAGLLLSTDNDVAFPSAAEMSDTSASLQLVGMVIFEAANITTARRAVRMTPYISGCVVPGAAPELLDAETSERIRALTSADCASPSTLSNIQRHIPVSRVSRSKRHAYVRLRLPDGPHEFAVPLAGSGS